MKREMIEEIKYGMHSISLSAIDGVVTSVIVDKLLLPSKIRCLRFLLLQPVTLPISIKIFAKIVNAQDALIDAFFDRFGGVDE